MTDYYTKDVKMNVDAYQRRFIDSKLFDIAGNVSNACGSSGKKRNSALAYSQLSLRRTPSGPALTVH